MRPIDRLRQELDADTEARRRQRQRAWAREAFPGTAGGAALTAAPVAERVTRVPAVNVSRNQTQGQSITLTADTTIPDGGGFVTFDTIIETIRHGFTAVTAPTDTLVAPWTGISGFPVIYLRWKNVDSASSWRGDGAWMALYKNSGEVFPRWEARTTELWTSQLGPVSSPHLPVASDDALQLWIQQDSGASQDVEVVLTWGMEDPNAVIARDIASAAIGDEEVRVPVPTGAGAGDLLLAFAYSREQVVTSPSGWARETTDSDQDGTRERIVAVDSRIMQSGDSSWTWQTSGGIYHPSEAITVVIVAVKTGTTVDVADSDVNLTGDIASLAVTPTASPSHLVAVAGHSQGAENPIYSSTPTTFRFVRAFDVPDNAHRDTISVHIEAITGTSALNRTVTDSGAIAAGAAAVVVTDS